MHRNFLFHGLALLLASAMIMGGVSRAQAYGGGEMPAHTEQAMDDSLYARLGGTDAIAAVIDRFVDVLAADPRIGANPRTVERLSKHSLAGIKFQVTAFVIMATGGPMVYHGKDMKTAHSGLLISEEEWNAGAEDLVTVLKELNVPQELQDELLALVGSTHDDIVGQ
ncbi:group 1 truncated hemoglobin [bacterium]|nr:group 1 truncated hemoglobin [bacterium]